MTTDAPIVDDRRDALDRVALPSEHSQLELQYLFDHGYTAFHTADGDVDADGLASAVERFALEAFEPGDPRDRDGPFVEDPAVLAAITSLATVCVTDHPALADTPTDRLQLVADLRSLFAATVQDLVVDAGDDLVQALAEVIYAKDPGEQGPHFGRVCTGVVRNPEFLDDEGTFVEIPMPAASPECIVRVNDAGLGGKYDDRNGTVDGELATRVWDNNVYVPVEDCRRKHWERLKRGFGALVDAQNASLDEDQREWIRNRADGVGERIDRFLQSGQEGRVWKGWDGDDQLVQLVSSVLSASDLDRDGVYPAEVFFEALQRYEASTDWEASLCQRISSPSTLEARLADVENDRLEAVDKGGRRLFGIRSRSGGNELVVEAIEDLFELPCMGRMDDRLQEHGPVRKDLFNFVRTVLWLPEYESASVDEVVRDLQGVFERWPWHDPTETEYQIQYEFGNTIGGETPLPMNCDNDDMQRYCIGQDECPYSIWGSIPFTDSMYEAVNDDSTTARY
jgi:hypothetical protein